MNMRMKHLFVPDVRLHDGAFPKHVSLERVQKLDVNGTGIGDRRKWLGNMLGEGRG